MIQSKFCNQFGCNQSVILLQNQSSFFREYPHHNRNHVRKLDKCESSSLSNILVQSKLLSCQHPPPPPASRRSHPVSAYQVPPRLVRSRLVRSRLARYLPVWPGTSPLVRYLPVWSGASPSGPVPSRLVRYLPVWSGTSPSDPVPSRLVRYLPVWSGTFPSSTPTGGTGTSRLLSVYPPHLVDVLPGLGGRLHVGTPHWEARAPASECATRRRSSRSHLLPTNSRRDRLVVLHTQNLLPDERRGGRRVQVWSVRPAEGRLVVLHTQNLLPVSGRGGGGE